MSDELNIEGKLYISSKRAAEEMGYTQDYIGQLARAGSIDAKRISGLWYVTLESLEGHKAKADAYVPQPPRRQSSDMRREDIQTSVSFDGRTYISAARAAKITGYHQDYVSQLARDGKILAKQVGNKWYVDQDGIQSHKKEKDALLGAVQAASVGVVFPATISTGPAKNPDAGFVTNMSYFSENRPLIPELKERPENIVFPAERTENPATGRISEESIEHVIPIRIVRSDGTELASSYGNSVENTNVSRSVPASSRKTRRTSVLARVLLTTVPALTIVIALSLSWQLLAGKQQFAVRVPGNAFTASAYSAFESFSKFIEKTLSSEIEYTAR